jgi:hypothetical protein
MTKQNAREQGRIILAHGEVTGHCHEVVTTDTGLPPGMDEAQFFTDPATNDRVLVLVGPAVLRHDEHDPIALDPSHPAQFRQGDVFGHPIGGGAWRITRQREYAPDAIRNVAD